MWHAARAQERKIRQMMNEHRKRSERRRAYYETIVRPACCWRAMHDRSRH